MDHGLVLFSVMKQKIEQDGKVWEQKLTQLEEESFAKNFSHLFHFSLYTPLKRAVKKNKKEFFVVSKSFLTEM